MRENLPSPILPFWWHCAESRHCPRSGSARVFIKMARPIARKRGRSLPAMYDVAAKYRKKDVSGDRSRPALPAELHSRNEQGHLRRRDVRGHRRKPARPVADREHRYRHRSGLSRESDPDLNSQCRFAESFLTSTMHRCIRTAGSCIRKAVPARTARTRLVRMTGGRSL
jgi:hypothetical protein